MAIYIKQNNQLKQVGLGTCYKKESSSLLDPIQYRAEHRDTNWPFIPLPSEIHSTENTDCIYFLFCKDNINGWCVPFVRVTGSSLAVNIKKYNNTTLVSEDTTQTISSNRSLNIEYNSTDSDWNNWNYVLMKVTGTITAYNMNIAPTHSGTAVTSTNMLLEVSGYCSNYSITILSGKHYYNLTYFGIGGSYSNTSVSGMFSGCYALQAVHTLDTSKVTIMSSMFYQCYSLQAIPQLDTSKVTSTGSMFNYCYLLQAIPQLDTSKVTSTGSMFSGCCSLRTIPTLNISNVTEMGNMFYQCYSLQDIGNTSFKYSVSLSPCYSLNYNVIMKVINNLATVTASNTLTVPIYLKSLLLPSDIAIATNKGWVIA